MMMMMSLSLSKGRSRSSDFGDESLLRKTRLLHVPYHFANSADKAALFGAGAFLTVFLTVTDFFTGAVFLTAFGFFAGVGFFAGAVFLVTCKQKQRHHQHHREIDNKIYLIKKRTFLLTVLAGAGADFFMIALTVTAIVVVVLRALNVKTFFSETKRVKKKERQGERPKTRGRFKTTLSSIFFFVGFWVSKRYEKIASRDFLLLLLLLLLIFFFHRERRKKCTDKSQKNAKRKAAGAVKKEKKKKGKERTPTF